MVKNLKIALAFVRLIRLPNLVIIAITQYFMRWFILKPVLKETGFEVQLGALEFALLVLSTMSIAAAGYIINDYFDRKLDLINRPGRVIVGRLISRRYAMFFHFFFSALGVLCGALVAMSIGRLSLIFIFLFAVGVLWFYSTTYKRQILVGNMVISVLVGLVPLMVLFFEMPLLIKAYSRSNLIHGTNFDLVIAWISAYAAFAFMINLIREIIKDMEDFEGDAVFGRQTIPIAWGMKAARNTAIVLIGMVILPVLYVLYTYFPDKISFIYIILFIVVPLILIAFGTFWASTKQQYHTLSNMVKITMLTGLLYCPIVNYLLEYFTEKI
ncbi:MAG: geranylgeranylglycerol-phosphate geranylgeranyltransferase [Bacteroidales bacterium]|nr:geranylgeranylglycerol-phosphate geranylgeranyltransferase [Bacteroidales bacterium]